MQRERRGAVGIEDSPAPGLDELLSLTAHELHEPLRKMAAFGELLRQHAGPVLDEESLDYLARMQRATERMRTTLARMLAFARVTQGLPFAPIDLGEVAACASESLQARVEAAGATVEVGALPSITGDPFQMQELFEQLLDNALQFRREGVPPRIQITAETTADGFHLIHIADNGQGFDDAYAERIFRPFERLHGRGKLAGAGMGLSICRKIAERHGGRLVAAGKPEEGAVLTLTLPAQADRAADSSIPSPA